MCMHNAPGTRTVAVNRSVQAPGGRIRCIILFQDTPIIYIKKQQIAGPNSREMALVRIQKKTGTVSDGQGKMIGYTFVKI